MGSASRAALSVKGCAVSAATEIASLVSAISSALTLLLTEFRHRGAGDPGVSTDKLRATLVTLHRQLDVWASHAAETNRRARVLCDSALAGESAESLRHA